MAHETHHHHDDGHGPHDHDRGLQHDVGTLLARRQVLGLFAGAGLGVVGVAGLVACGSGSDGTASAAGATSTGSATTTTTGSASLVSTSTTGIAIPEETAGPYPGDGSNGVNVLTESGIVRSDIRASFGGSTTVAEGVPVTVALTVLDAANNAPLAGAAVYLWHCDRDGQYSLYSDAIADENYLRGVQEADADGLVTFTTIFPAAYSGRWPHIHFEVYESVDAATSAGNLLATSQLAFPEDVCEVVYATAGYEQSVQNLEGSSLETDNVFSDGYESQLADVEGSVEAGYTARLAVPV